MEKNTIAFMKQSSKDSFLEVKACYDLGKISIGLYKYNAGAEKGNKITDKVICFFNILEASYLGHQLSDSIVGGGEITTPFLLQAKINRKDAGPNGYAKEVYQALGGNEKEGKVTSRIFRIECGNKYPLVCRALSGPGKKTPEGLFTPTYDFTHAEQKVIVPFTKEESIKLGLALLHACDLYYSLNSNKFV